MSYRALAVLMLAACLCAGCATPIPMAYSPDSKAVVKPTNAVLLMTATIRNAYHESFQPHLLVVNVERAGAANKSDRLNFKVDTKARFKEEDSREAGNTYLVRMELPPGEYVIRGLTCLSPRFPIMGSYFAPLHEDVAVAQPGVFYLGHVTATVRERKENEFRAGPVIPLLDQAVAGASGGTFDVVISDHWDVDEATFRSAFPQLGGVTIQKSVLRPFDRALAQDWWEKH